MLIAAILVIPTIAIEQLSADTSVWAVIAGVLNWVIWIVFALEAVLLFSASENKLRWVRKHPLELMIVILSTPVMPPGLQSTRALRLLRLVRLARVATLTRTMFSLKGLYWAAFLSLILVIGGGAAFTIVEKVQDLTYWDGIYWAISTVTAFGSDVSPSTNLGRAISISVLFIGTGFFAILTAAVTERFMQYARRNPNIKTADSETTELLEDIQKRLIRIEKKLNDRK